MLKLTYKAAAIINLKLSLIVGHIIKAFQNQNLKHHHYIKGRPSSFIALLAHNMFFEDDTEHFPVDDGVSYLQRIANLTDFFHSVFFIEETFHSYFHASIIPCFDDSFNGFLEVTYCFCCNCQSSRFTSEIVNKSSPSTSQGTI